jgi:hypothetical protein
MAEPWVEQLRCTPSSPGWYSHDLVSAFAVPRSVDRSRVAIANFDPTISKQCLQLSDYAPPQAACTGP